MRKTRAERDAEQLAALEAEQRRIDSGEPDPSETGQAAPLPPAEPEALKPTAEPAPAAANGEDTEELKRQIANMKRTLSYYEQELNPAQRRAQQLEREVEELRNQLANASRAPESPTDYGLTEEEKEFETVTSIAEKVNKATSNKMFKEIEALKEKLSEFEGVNTQHKIDAQVAKHKSDLSKALGGDNPDDLFGHPKINEWADEQAEEEGRALHYPLAYSPKFVAGILLRFKSEVMKGQAPRVPSHGEAGVPSRVTPDTVQRVDGSPSDPTFNPDTFQSDVNKLIRDGKGDQAKRLVAIAERAMSA